MNLTLTQTRHVTVGRDEAATGVLPIVLPAFTAGTIENLRVDVTAGVSGGISAENLDAAPVALNAGVSVGLALSAETRWEFYPGYVVNVPVLNAVGSGVANVALAAFDGTADFGGASGVAAAPLAGSTTTSASFAGSAANWAYGTGSELRLGLITTFSGFAGAGGGVRLRSETGADVEIRLTYDYTPLSGVTGTAGSVDFVSGTGTTIAVVAGAVAQPVITTPVQHFTYGSHPTGWSDVAQVARFDAALGTLQSVNLRMRTTLDTSGMVESHMAQPISLWARQTGLVAVSLPGGAALATAGADRYGQYAGLGAADGVDDFAGSGGALVAARSDYGSVAAQLSAADVLAAFTGAGTVDLPVASRGTSTFDGLDDMLAELHASADAVLEVSYTYAPAVVQPGLGMANITTGQNSMPATQAYAGPVAGISQEFAAITADNLALWAGTDGWYLRGGDGNDAIRANGGVNVVDGAGGSNFLTGGAGQDTFFVDAQWVAAPIWNTITNLQPGDSVTVWGITQGYHSMAWRDGQGAAGYEGLTLHARAPGGPAASVTLSGYSNADFALGRLVSQFGTADGIPYLNIAAM